VFLEHSLYERLANDAMADRFAIVTKPGADIPAVQRRLERFVQANHIPASVLTRTQMASYLVSSIQSLFSITEGIQVVALIVATLIVLSTMLTATFERSKEFAIERILGMSRRQLGGSVVLEATAIAAIGATVATAIGLGLGFIMTSSIEDELAWRISFSPSPWLVLGTILLTTSLGALAALYPSLLATRQTIVRLLGDM
jgi:putative ABC transport system permease protein